MGFGFYLKDGDWNRLRQIIQKLSSIKLGPESTPTFESTTLSSASISSFATLSATISSLVVTSTNINHNDLNNVVADEHIAHSGVIISAQGILVGGGTISASVAISLQHSSVDHNQTTNVHQSVTSTDTPAFYGVTISNAAGITMEATLAAGTVLVFLGGVLVSSH